jgi:glycosyltransferase involved in cell wall biosynthesis
MVEGNNMKLLMVTTIPGTLRAFLLHFAHHFRKLGWRVDAMAQGISDSAECLQAFDRVWDVKWSRNPLDPRNLIIAPKIIRDVVAQEAYDIVHVHTPVAAFVSRYALKDFRKQGKLKVIYTAHGFHFYRGGKPLKNTVFLNLEKFAGSWTDYLIVINREDEEAAKRHHIVPSERVRYMPGIGANLDYYNADAVSQTELEKVRQELGITQENPLFLSVAEFIPRKRHQDVILAFAKLDRLQVHLALAGDGPLMAEMQQLASDLKVKERVHFLGERGDIPTLMRASAATLLASQQEGLPRCVMESLCMEIPVIGTEIRGTRDLLEGGNGLLVKLGDINGIASAMAWILDHPEEAQQMGKRGRENMVNYDLPHILKLYEALYAEVNNQQSTINP